MNPAKLPSPPGLAPEWAEAPQSPKLDRYTLGPELGRGGMGRVAEAWDPVLKRVVALKQLHGNGPEAMLRFLREAQVQARLEHPHVCRILDLGESDSGPYIAMQRIHGPDLSQLRPELGFEDMARILADVASAVHSAHRAELIHRDLKPSNVLVERLSDGSLHPYVVDFGLARDLSAPDFTLSWAAMGTPAFMSPEQARCETLGPATDLYSLGATLYALLSGQPPFESATLAGLLTQQSTAGVRAVRRLNPKVPKDLETITLKCLEEDPAKRYESAFALEEDLRRFLAGEPIRARPVGPLGRLWRWAKRRPALSGTLAASLIAVTLLGAWNLRTLRQARIREQVAQRFALEIRDAEHLLRIERMMPIHDIRPAEARLRARMASIRQDMERLGGIAKGPGLYALGRGHLALREVDQARETLQGAWEAGFRPPEVAFALGLAYFRTFDARMPSNPWGPNAIGELLKLRQVWLVPAASWFQRAQGASTESPSYGEGLRAFAEGNFAQAKASFAKALEEAPWLYEALYFQAKSTHSVFSATPKTQGVAAESLHSVLLESVELLDLAARLAPSDVDVQVQLGNIWNGFWIDASARGSRDPGPLLQAGKALKNAIRIRPDAEDLRLALAMHAMQEGFCLLSSGDDPGAKAWEQAKQLQTMLERHPWERGEARSAASSLGHNLCWVAAEADLRFGRNPQAALALAREFSRGLSDPDPHLAFPLMLAAQWEQLEGRNPLPCFQEAEAALAAAKHAMSPGAMPFHCSIQGECLLEKAHALSGNPSASLATVRQAIQALEAGMESNPTFIYTFYYLPRAYSLQARLLKELGGNSEQTLRDAVRAAERGITINPRNAQAQFAAAEAYLTRARLGGGDPQPWLARARRALDAGEAVNARHFAAKRLRAEVELHAAQREDEAGRSQAVYLTRADKACRQGFALQPHDPGLKRVRQRLSEAFAATRPRTAEAAAPASHP